jgi:hypothetical protein
MRRMRTAVLLIWLSPYDMLPLDTLPIRIRNVIEEMMVSSHSVSSRGWRKSDDEAPSHRVACSHSGAARHTLLLMASSRPLRSTHAPVPVQLGRALAFVSSSSFASSPPSPTTPCSTHSRCATRPGCSAWRSPWPTAWTCPCCPPTSTRSSSPSPCTTSSCSTARRCSRHSSSRAPTPS